MLLLEVGAFIQAGVGGPGVGMYIVVAMGTAYVVGS